MNWTLLQNSVLVSGAVTALAAVFGFVSALWLLGLDARWQARFVLLAALAMALPPFLVTNCWLYFLGRNGVWRGWLPLDIFSFGGTVWILALLTWPVTLLATLGAWQALESSQLESDPSLTGWNLLRHLLFPLARPALGPALLLTFVLALNNFAVPAILQVKVFPAEVWVEFSTTFDSWAALRTSWPMIVGPLALLLWWRRAPISWPRDEGRPRPESIRRQLGGGWFWLGGVCAVGLVVISLGLPLAQLALTGRTWPDLPGAFAAGQSAAFNSFLFAALSATIVVLLGALTWRWRWGALLWLPFLTPGVLLGIGWIFLLNRSWLTVIYQSSAVVILALTARYLALGWSGVAEAMGARDRDLEDAARLSGARGWRLWRDVQWPQIGPQVAAAWYLTYLLCLWDVETLVLILPPGAETLAVRVFNLLHYGHNSNVNALCLLLLILAAIPWAVWRAARLWASARAAGGVGGPRVPMVAAFALALVALAPGCTPRAINEATVASRIFDRVRVIGARGTGPGQFNKPRSVALDAGDNLYVVDITGRVQKFAPDGSFLLSWQMPQTERGKPKGMGRDARGNIIVVEPHYSRVNHFTPDGKLVAQWGNAGTNSGQLGAPRSVAVNSRGELYVSEYGDSERVQKFSGDGQRLLSALGRPGAAPGEFNRAEGLGVDAADRVYVADSCNHRIQIFGADGAFLRAYGRAGSGAGELSYPYDVRVDAEGRQYVCEFGNSRVQIFDAQDHPLEILGGPGAEPGKFSNPWAIALDSKGDLYVADGGNNRVQRFERRRR